jgi:purine-binding chemotaxis protein CheW
MHGAMLVTRVGGMACAFPIDQVVETMRPLAIEPIGTSSDRGLAAIAGMAMIRGVPLPVIDARRLLGISDGVAGRFVIVRVADRRLAVAVDAVVEVRHFDRETLAPLPPLIRAAGHDCVIAIGSRDAALLAVLDAARLLREDAWQAIYEAGAGSPPE